VLEAWVAVVALARWVVQVLAVLVLWAVQARVESINLATLQVSLRLLLHRP
jgi:hypothetical protein